MWIKDLWRKFWSLQFSRFLLIGSINTLADFLIVNSLAYLFQSYHGFSLIIINSFSFITVVTLSFFLNKNWTFARTNDQPQARTKKYLIFVLVTLIGLILNNSIVYLITTVIGPEWQLSRFIWLNFAKVLAACIILFWNFFNYKYLVFRQTNN